MAWNLKQKAQDHIVSIGLGLIVLLLLVIWRAIDPSVWDRVSEATSKRALWALLGLAGIAICLLIGALVDNFRKRKQASKPAFKAHRELGIHWDERDNPLCPACECLMPIHHSDVAGDILWCPRCKTHFALRLDSGERLTLERAKAFVDFIHG
jgi:hypothetical protein